MHGSVEPVLAAVRHGQRVPLAIGAHDHVPARSVNLAVECDFSFILGTEYDFVLQVAKRCRHKLGEDRACH